MQTGITFYITFTTQISTYWQSFCTKIKSYVDKITTQICGFPLVILATVGTIFG